ncbi:MAG: alpha-galactosidase [Clostridia bacterium]|nr:alpha-galactosidase [Clostridia bacterium]
MNTIYSRIKSDLFSDFTAKLTFEDNTSVELSDYTETVLSDRVILSYKPTEKIKIFELTVKCSDKAAALYVNAVLDGATFALFNAISFKLGKLIPEKILGSHFADNHFWKEPAFINSYDDMHNPYHSLLIKNGEEHLYIVTLCGDNFRTECDHGQIGLTAEFPNLNYYSGEFAAVAISSDPYEAADNAHKFARQCGAIRVLLRHERHLPDHFKKLGWCSWNAFATDVDEAKLFMKLDEFKKKNVPVKWIIIDDGWMQTRNGMLCSFIENRAKFPSGLKSTVKRIKEEYGIEKVAVWHACLGYWEGVDPESSLYAEMKDYLFLGDTGRYVPSLDEDKAYVFWNTWHSYLKDCGIDFLKVDNQSSNSYVIRGTMPTATGCRHVHNALERSIMKNFDGAVINCMGMYMENVLARPFSAVSRNSDDFFPCLPERDFAFHLTQNVYNALWHGQLYYCDFDMWWTHNHDAVQHGVLRAISGSPVYVSDAVEATVVEKLLPVIEDNGDVMYCDSTALPTSDCLYSDSRTIDKLLKIFNRYDDSFALAAFNLRDKQLCDTIDFTTVPGMSKDCDYVAYEYFTKKYIRVRADSVIDLALGVNGVASYSIYPIKIDENGNEYVMMGSTDKYVPIASNNKTKVLVSDIEF